MVFPLQNIPFNKRKDLAKLIKEKHPNVIPILIDIPKRSGYKAKYLVPKEIEFGDPPFSVPSTVGHFLNNIRKANIKLAPDEGLYLFANEVNLSPYVLMSVVYEKYADLDGFLYITVGVESVFG